MGGVRRQYPRMTPEQQKLATENHDLIAGYCQYLHLEEEDWYGDLAFALCRAAQIYDPSRNVRFSTVAYACFDRRVTREVWLANRQCRSGRLVHSTTITLSDDDDECQISLPDTEDGYAAVESQMVVDTFCRSIAKHSKPSDMEILGEYLDGRTVGEIADSRGVSRQWIDYLLKRFGKRAIRYNLDPRTA